MFDNVFYAGADIHNIILTCTISTGDTEITFEVMISHVMLN